MSILDSALTMARAGFRVFPLAPGSKAPPKGLKWREAATTDESTIRDWFRETPNANYGVAMGGGVLAIDVDGAAGAASLDYLDVLGLEPSFRVTTPGGGVHVYVKVDGEHGNRVKSIPDLPGIDLRSDGGYVVGPGSVVNGRAYRADGDPAMVAPAGEWLENMLKAGAPTRVAAAKNREPLVELDQPENIALAIEYLEQRAPEAIEGAGGDAATFAVASAVRDYAISEEVALDLIADRWNEEKASPPWAADELADKVANAYRYAVGPWGARTAAGEFKLLAMDLGEDPAELDIGSPPSARVRLATPEPDADLPIVRASDLASKPIPAREWHVPGLIPAGRVTLLYGDGGTGKSLLAMQLAAATATGRDWLGQPVAAGRCLYLSAEDDEGEMHRRLADIQRAADGTLSDLDRLELLDLSGRDAVLGALDRAGVDIVATPFYKRIKAHCAAHRPRLLIVDTLADAFGGNEIIRVQVRRFVGLLQGIARDSGAAVLVLAHPSVSGMSSGSGTSGSTAWNNSVRSRLYFERCAKDGIEADPDRRVLRTMKANYGPAGGEMELRWRAGVFVRSSRQDAETAAAEARVDSIFLELVRAYAAEGRPVGNTPSAHYAPKCFADDPRGQGVTKAAFVAAMYRVLADDRARIGTVRTNHRDRPVIVAAEPAQPAFIAADAT